MASVNHATAPPRQSSRELAPYPYLAPSGRQLYYADLPLTVLL